ncbi:integrase core domain-containing protein [Streptomyces canus]|uniref:integrase core domain-containing protein n=1 Tax=Streptomyces canus TaxID=58343 RepID=UPI00367B7DE5
MTPIRRCLTDNGARYRSTTWADALAATGTKHKRTRPYTPRTNGKGERYNGTLSHEWAYVRDYTTERERRDALAEFVYYNHERPHAALGGPTAHQPDHREQPRSRDTTPSGWEHRQTRPIGNK